jgi:hypothetical protein
VCACVCVCVYVDHNREVRYVRCECSEGIRCRYCKFFVLIGNIKIAEDKKELSTCCKYFVIGSFMSA